MPKRGENIRKRKDGRWEGRYICGYDPVLGRSKYKSVYGKTYKEANEHAKTYNWHGATPDYDWRRYWHPEWKYEWK